MQVNSASLKGVGAKLTKARGSDIGARPVNDELEALLGSNHADAVREAEEPFDRLMSDGRAMVLFGAGEVGLTALRVLRREGVNVVALSDNNPLKWGRSLDGMPVLSPVTAARQFGDDAVFIITYKCNDETYHRERLRLNGLGAREVHPISLLLKKWPEISGFAAESPDFYIRQWSQVLRTFDLLADDESRRQFVGHMTWRLLRNYFALPTGNLTDQYFQRDIVTLLSEERLVDGGAYDGDSIRDFLHDRCERFGWIHAFEPDPHSVASLRDFVGRLPAELSQRITVWPYALSDRQGETRFTALGNHSSFIGEGGETVVVPTVALDDILNEEPVTFIKFDLEGAEIPAIKGAEAAIGRNRPIITVAVYHDPGHLLEIPLRLRELCDNYRFYLRTHNSFGLDVVLYAVPQERVIQPGFPP